MWYSIVLASRLSTKIKTWTTSYLYQSIKNLMAIKGKPSTERVYHSVFLRNKATTIQNIWSHSIVNRLLKTPLDERDALAARYNLGNDNALDYETLVNMQNNAVDMWIQAKLMLVNASPGLMKWWANTRFQGHTKSVGVIKCTCLGQPTVNQVHIINCSRFNSCYAETAAEHNVTPGHIKHILSERDPAIMKAEEVTHLNSIEKTLSEKIDSLLAIQPNPQGGRPRRGARH